MMLLVLSKTMRSRVRCKSLPLLHSLFAVALATGCSSGAASGGKDSGHETGGIPDVPVENDRVDTSVDLGSSSEVISDPAWGALLNACFEGLPAPVGLQILAQKSSGDATTQVRLALDTMGKTGLAYPWTMVRMGVVIDNEVICVTEKNDLAYTVTHHNCNDVASATAGATRLELIRPADGSTELRIFSGSALVNSITLTTRSCVRSDGPGTCPLVGPC
jgi:hypothetical protein